MKTNTPKRKVFQDAVDLISPVEEMATTVSNGYEMISIEKIVPFHNHPFRLYEGERLNDMVENVREHGILTPVIVQKTDTGYEMLAGHNRMNAAKIVGITEIPAIIKENLTEREAYVYVIETNMLQRSFSELTVSEKAAVLAERYDKVLSQGKRNDIINELTELDGTCGHGVHKSRDDIGEDYGMSGRSAARLMRVNYLVPELKEKVDSGELSFVAGVGLSYLSEEEQRLTLEQKLAHGGHPVLRWMMDNIFIRTDPAGNIKADKEKSTEKIDGAIATIMGLDRAIRCGSANTESVYDTRGLLVF